MNWLICYIFLKLQLTSSQEPVDQCLPAGQVLEGLGDLEGPDPKAIQRVLCIYIYIKCSVLPCISGSWKHEIAHMP